jgi:hypothetical protein
MSALSIPVREGERTRLRRGERGRYAPPPLLFPVVAGAAGPAADWEERFAVERDADGAYLVRRRDTGRIVARTADPATLQRLLATLAGA